MRLRSTPKLTGIGYFAAVCVTFYVISGPAVAAPVACENLWGSSGFHSTRQEKITNRFVSRAREKASEILQDYPPDQYVVVALGRTTPLLSEWLRRLANRQDYVFERAVLDLRDLFENGTEKAQDAALTSLLPTAAQLRGRQIVILRVLLEGQTVGAMLEPLIHFIQTHPSLNGPITLRLFSSAPPDEMRENLESYIRGKYRASLNLDLEEDKAFVQSYVNDTSLLPPALLEGSENPYYASDLSAKNWKATPNPRHSLMKRWLDRFTERLQKAP